MKKLALCIALGVLTGCAANAPIAPPIGATKAAVSYNSVSAVNYQTLDVMDGAIRIQADISSMTPNLNADGQQSAVLGWKVPSYGAYKFTVNSQIKRSNFGRAATAFMPEVLLLDSQFNVIRTIPASKIDYEKPALMSMELLSHTFSVDNRDPMSPPVEYILVKTSDSARQQRVEVVDIDKEYAKVRGQTPPMTPDIFTSASEAGRIILDVEPLTSGHFARSPEVNIPVSPTPAHAFTGSDAPVKTASVQFDTISVSREFSSEVRKKINAGDIEQALSMRQFVGELKDKTGALFTSLYRQPAANIVVQTEFDDGTIESKLAHHYEQQMKLYFKHGNKQAALKLIDQINHLSSQVDLMF